MPHLFFCIVFSLVVTLPFSAASARMLSVEKESVRLRTGPGVKYSIKWEYGKGFPLQVVTQRKGWVKVRDFERDIGWVKRELLSRKPHMIVKVNKKKKRKINIRSGPGTRFKIIGKAYYGVVFETVKQKKGWVNIRHESGLVGWVNRSLLWGF